jgi:hypothetical protein
MGREGIKDPFSTASDLPRSQKCMVLFLNFYFNGAVDAISPEF